MIKLNEIKLPDGCPPKNNIILGDGILVLNKNGNIYVNGKLTENDKGVVEGLRQLLSGIV